MKYCNLLLKCPKEKVDLVSEWFIQQDAISVSVEDGWYGTEKEVPCFDDPTSDQAPFWDNNIIKVCFEEGEFDWQRNLSFLKDEPFWEGDIKFELEEVEDCNWIEKTRAQFQKMEIGRLVLCPSWELSSEIISNDVLILDPGMAFGTGQHPTTFLCLKWLEKNLEKGCSLLDYGCGSSILALAALKLGANEVQAVDIDPLAIEASLKNAALNEIQLNVSLVEEAVFSPVDLLVANILANPLLMLVDSFSSYVKPRGRILLSGILEKQLPIIQESYEKYFDVIETGVQGEWAFWAGQKRC